jgi:hypothetical protein
MQQSRLSHRCLKPRLIASTMPPRAAATRTVQLGSVRLDAWSCVWTGIDGECENVRRAFPDREDLSAML